MILLLRRTSLLRSPDHLIRLDNTRNKRIADHEGRRSVEPECSAQLHGRGNMSIDLGGLHIATQLRDIKFDFFGDPYH